MEKILICKMYSVFFFDKGMSRLESISDFLRIHTELKLYGFALCLSSIDEKSINYYFVSNNLS